MFCITIKFKNDPAPWSLLYKTEDSAKIAWKLFEPGLGSAAAISDDFGQTAIVNHPDMAGVMLEDLDKSMLAHVERAIHTARTQAKAQQLAMSDPVLKTAAMTRGQSPAMFAPQGNGFHP